MRLMASSSAHLHTQAVIRQFHARRQFGLRHVVINIKMIEVNSQPYLTAKETDLDKTTSAVNLAEMPVTDKLKGPVKNKKDEAKTDKVLAVASRKIETPQPPKNLEASKQGGLFRASIQVSDLDTLGVRITDKLVALGGTKAGEVELGWKKSPKVLYYHLVLPAENIDQMQEFLNKFGQLNIQFENHPRLMPIGFKRIILEVKEGE